MFTDQLTAAERKSLVRLVAFIATADGKIDPRESTFIADLTARLDLKPGDFSVGEDGSLASLCASFTRPAARRIALVEILNAAYSDGEYADQERQEMIYLAELMDVDVEVLGELEQWVAEGIRWQDRGRVLLGLS